MRLLLITLVIAFAGCAEVPVKESPEPWQETLDVLELLERDTIVLVGYRASQETNVEYDKAGEFTVTTTGRAAQVFSWSGLQADVEGLQQAGERGEVPQTWWGSGGGGSGGGGSSGLTGDVRWQGTAIYEHGGGTSHHSTTGRGGGVLEAGEWLLVVAGMCGNDKVEGHWTWDIHASAPLEKVVLPSTAMACGNGFDEFPRTNIGPLHLESIEKTWPATYGASLQLLWMGSGLTKPDGEWIVSDIRVPLGEGSPREASRTPGEMGFEVQDHADFKPLWVFKGLFYPF